MDEQENKNARNEQGEYRRKYNPPIPVKAVAQLHNYEG